ncbi:MAG: ABC transporter permease subunit [Candidatus Latescibacteria bacterium]|nr:ABC transporter permease subunit [Candidatus Latescibacterota bacterium]
MENSTREQIVAWGFLSPALIILAGFGLFPIGFAFYVSLHRWQIRREGLIGFDHYIQALGQPRFIAYVLLGVLVLWAARRVWRGWGLQGAAAKAVGLVLVLPALWLLIKGVPGLLESGDFRLYNGFRVTFFYAFLTIPVQLACALALAYLLFKSLRGQGVFRVLFFLPYVTPLIASAVVFRTLFNPHPSALANRFWNWLGFENQRWLYEHKTVVRLVAEAMDIGHYPGWIDEFFPSLALVSIILYNIWVYIGYDTVILLAGLSAIPRHYYEAAEIDGADSWQMFRNITLPLVSPTLFFLSMLAVIGTFKAFNHIYIMRTPGARETVDVLSVSIFDQIFQYHNAGYAAALAFILFVAILGLTYVQNSVLGKRVFYGD